MRRILSFEDRRQLNLLFISKSSDRLSPIFLANHPRVDSMLRSRGHALCFHWRPLHDVSIATQWRWRRQRPPMSAVHRSWPRMEGWKWGWKREVPGGPRGSKIARLFKLSSSGSSSQIVSSFITLPFILYFFFRQVQEGERA